MAKINKMIIIGIFAVGVPAAIQNLLNVTGMTVLNNFTSEFGSEAVAAMGISQKINMVPMYVTMGLSQGIMPLISYTYSSANIKRMKDTILISAKLSILFLVVIAAGFYLFAENVINLFMTNAQIVSYGSAFLRGFCIGLPFLCMDFLAVGVFQATGKGKNAFIFAVSRKIILEIPALFILNKLFPLYGLAYAQFAAEVVLAVAAVIVLRNMLHKLMKQHS